MKNLFIVFFCLVSVLAIKANGQESLWKIQAVDYQGTYYGAAVANGGIGILPWKEPFSVRHVMLNHVFDAAAPQDVSRVLRGINPFNLQMQIDGQGVSGDNISGWRNKLYGYSPVSGCPAFAFRFPGTCKYSHCRGM